MRTVEDYTRIINDEALADVLTHAETVTAARRGMAQLGRNARRLRQLRREINQDLRQATSEQNARLAAITPRTSAAWRVASAERAAHLDSYRRVSLFCTDLLREIVDERKRLRAWLREVQPAADEEIGRFRS